MDTIEKSIQRLLYRVAAEIANEAQNEAPVKTRNLRNDIKVYENGNTFEIGNSKLAEYAKYVHFGTGIYGPKKRRIRPKTAKRLKFSTGGKTIYTKSVKGQKPNPYFERALNNYIRGGGLERALSASRLDQEIKIRLENKIRSANIEISD